MKSRVIFLGWIIGLAAPALALAAVDCSQPRPASWGVADPIVERTNGYTQADWDAACAGHSSQGTYDSPSGRQDCANAPQPQWGIADPVVAAIWNQCHPSAGAAGVGGQTTGNHGGASTAAVDAGVASKMTGVQSDSQHDILSNSQSLNHFGGSSSHESGVLDTLEGILLLPFDILTGGALLDSGHHAQEAADHLKDLENKVSANSNKMGGIPSSSGASSSSGSGQSGSGASSDASHGSAGASSSGALASERAQNLFSNLEKLGVDRNDFLNATNSAHGDPERVGEFMQEKTGDSRYGKEAVASALDAFAAASGTDRAALMAARGNKEEPSAVAQPSGPTAAAAAAAPDVNRKIAALALPKDTKLRDKLRKNLTERFGKDGDEVIGKETLEPLREDAIFHAEDGQSEISLFDVVHKKYLTIGPKLAPTLTVGAPLLIGN